MSRVGAVIPVLAVTAITLAVMMCTDREDSFHEGYRPISGRLVAASQKPLVVMRGSSPPEGFDLPPLPVAPYREKAQSGDPEALANWSAVLVSQERDSLAALDAIVVARQALAGNPRLAAAHFNLAMALERVGLAPEARAAYDKAAELETDEEWIDRARTRSRIPPHGFRLARESAESYLATTADPGSREVLAPYLIAREQQRNLGIRRRNAAGRVQRLAYIAEEAADLIERMLWRVSRDLNPREKNDSYAERVFLAGLLQGQDRSAEALPLLISLDGDAYDAKGRAGLDAQLVCEQVIHLVARGKLLEAIERLDEEFDRSVAARQHALATMYADLARSVRANLMYEAFLRRDFAAAYAYAADPSLDRAWRWPLADVQRALDKQAAIIEYKPLHEQTIAFVIRRDSVHVVTFDVDAATIFGSADSMRNAVDTNFATRAARLHLHAFRQVAERLDDISTIAVIPHRELLGIPFGALLDVDRGEHVFERFKVVHAESAREAIEASRRARGAADETLLAIAATEFGDRSVPALPSAADEVFDIAALSRCAQVLVGREATPDAIRRQLVDNAVVHYAGHIVRGGAEARLMLADDALSATDIERIPLAKPRVVVLAACRGASTGQPHAILPNVADAFLAAGVPAVIASAYDVDDALAPATMRRLHLFLRDGDDAADALRKTAIAELQSGRGVPLSMRFMTMGGTSSLVRRD